MSSETIRSEDGAVAVMYSVLLLVLIGFVGIVLDIGALRADRRNTQLLADNAATSGGTFLLEEFDGSPMTACTAAWEYFLLNAPDIDPDGPWDNPCDGTSDGGPSIDSWTCETAPAYDPDSNTGPWVVGTAGAYEAVIVWPVPDELIAGDGYSEELDGEPCERLGVWIRRTRGFIFGAIFAQGAEVGAPAVARASVGEASEEVASLVVLDPTGCKALDVQGQGIAAVRETGEGPGIIAIDSDASKETPPNDRNCTQGAGQVAIHADDNSSGNCPAGPQIKAGLTDASYTAWLTDAGTCTFEVGSGIITSKALSGPYDARAYDETDITADRLGPRPIAGDRITRQIADHVYDCKASYSFQMPYAQQDGSAWACPKAYDPNDPSGEALPPYITDLRDVVGVTEDPGSSSPEPSEPTDDPVFPDYTGRSLFGEYEDVTFTRYKAWMADPANGYDTIVGDPCKMKDSDGPVVLPAGNWWVDCETLSIGNSLTFTRGNVVTDGAVEVHGSLTVNAANDARSDGFLFIRNGRFHKVAQATVTMNRTFVYLHNGWIDFRAGSPPLTWIGPNDDIEGEYPSGTSYPFDDLNLWSQNTDPHKLGGQSTLDIEGIFFIPRAQFIYNGQGKQAQKKAQFLTWRMNVRGKASLIMRPDPSRNLPIPILQVKLIR